MSMVNKGQGGNDQVSDRLTNFLYTLEVDGHEKKMQTVSGLSKTVNDSEWSHSEMEDIVDFPGRVEFDDLTFTYHPNLSEGGDGKPGTPYPSFVFEVEIDNEILGRVRSVDGVGVEAGVIESDEARKLTPGKQIGMRRYNDITLEQVYGDPGSRVLEDLMDRISTTNKAQGGLHQVDSMEFDDTVFDVTVRGLKRNRDPFLIFNAKGNWGSDISIEDLDSTDEDVLLKSMTIQPSKLISRKGLGEDPFDSWINRLLVTGESGSDGQPGDRPDYKRDLVLRAYKRDSQYGPQGEPVRAWRIYEAWCSQLEYATLDASSDDPWSVDATIVNEGFERIR